MSGGGLLGREALNRATLSRQLLLARSDLPVLTAVDHLVGLQAQTTQTWYQGLWCRLDAFDPEDLSTLLAERQVVRMALMRSTIHLVSAADAWGLRQLVVPVHHRSLRGTFGKRLADLDVDALDAAGRAIVDERPVTYKELGDRLQARWPDRDPVALSMRIRTAVPLVQVPPRGLWRRSGAARHTSIEAWLGAPPSTLPTVDDLVWRYLAAFGPASVADAQTWSGLTRLREVFDRLRPVLVTFRDDRGRELFDLPDAPRPDPATPAPPRLLYDFDNLLLSHDDRSRVITPDVLRALDRTPQGLITAVLLDGRVAGTWRVETGRGRGAAATISIRTLEPIAPADRQPLEVEALALLAFLHPDLATRSVRIVPP